MTYLEKGQIWKSKDEIEARVLSVGVQASGRSGSRTSMLGGEYVRYFNLKTRRQSTARIDTFRSAFPVFVSHPFVKVTFHEAAV